MICTNFVNDSPFTFENNKIKELVKYLLLSLNRLELTEKITDYYKVGMLDPMDQRSL
jgi:hypothetical protein